MRKPSLNRLSLSFLTLIAAALWTVDSASAATCRDIESVQKSADANKNTDAGGHLTQHILGMAPPPGTSQVGKTLFSSKGKYDSVWRQYQYVANPVGCSGNQAQQTVSLQALGISNLDAFSCTAANANGECTKWDSYMAEEVFFGFLLKNGKWILNTAFPVPYTR